MAIITPAKFPGTSGETATLMELIRQLIHEGMCITLICPIAKGMNSMLRQDDLDVIRIPKSPPRLTEISGGIGARHVLKFVSFILTETLVVLWNLKRKGIKHVIFRPSILTMQLPPILRLFGIIIIADSAELISDSLQPHVSSTTYKILSFIEKITMRSCSFFKVSSQSQSHALHKMGVPFEKIIQMPFSVDITKIPRIPISEIPENTFGYFGVLESWQGVNILVDAFEKLAERIPSARLYIIGGGSLSDYIREKISHNNLSANIILVNSISREVLWEEYFRKFRVVVIPRPRQNNSIDNILPIKLVEAMAAAKPVIASNIPVMREIPDSAILLFNCEDPDSLVSCMERVCIDSQLLKNLSENGLDFASRYDIRENIKKIVSVLGN